MFTVTPFLKLNTLTHQLQLLTCSLQTAKCQLQTVGTADIPAHGHFVCVRACVFIAHISLRRSVRYEVWTVTGQGQGQGQGQG